MTTRLAVTAGAALLLLGCSTRAVRIPSDLSGYEIVVEGRDTLSRAFARALDDAGFKVRAHLRGGNRPAAALVHFIFQDRPGGPRSLYARLADTRTGRIVAAAAQPLDSVVAGGLRAAALVSLLTASTP